MFFTHDRNIKHSDIISPLIRQKGDHPSSERFDLLERSLICHIERKRFGHFWAPAEINDELAVQHNVRRLDQRVVTVQEDSAEKSDFLDGVSVLSDHDPVTNIVWMLDEEENDTSQDFGEASTNQPAQTC